MWKFVLGIVVCLLALPLYQEHFPDSEVPSEFIELADGAADVAEAAFIAACARVVDPVDATDGVEDLEERDSPAAGAAAKEKGATAQGTELAALHGGHQQPERPTFEELTIQAQAYRKQYEEE